MMSHGGGTIIGLSGRFLGNEASAENLAKTPAVNSKLHHLRRFYYDCIVYTESALRFLIDTVGADRVVFGTDWPYDMALDWPVSWILAMESLTQAEKEAILWRNLERLLGI